MVLESVCKAAASSTGLSTEVGGRVVGRDDVKVAV